MKRAPLQALYLPQDISLAEAREALAKKIGGAVEAPRWSDLHAVARHHGYMLLPSTRKSELVEQALLRRLKKR